MGIAVPSHNFWRVPSLWNILLIPFFSYFIITISNYFTKKEFLKYIVVAILTISVLCLNFIISFHRTSDSRFTKHDMNVGKYIEKVLKKNSDSKVLIDTSNWQFANVRIASQYPHHFIFNTGKILIAKKVNNR